MKKKRERKKKKRLVSIPGYTLTVYPVELFWPVSALSCHRLDLTERSQTQLKCGKTISYLTRLFFTTLKPAIVAQIHAFHVALYCFSECDDFTCLSTGACIIIWQRFCCCPLHLKQTEKEAFQLFTFHNFTRSEPTHMKSGPRYPTEHFHWTGFNDYLL